jgi:hypothetical protein
VEDFAGALVDVPDLLANLEGLQCYVSASMIGWSGVIMVIFRGDVLRCNGCLISGVPDIDTRDVSW